MLYVNLKKNNLYIPTNIGQNGSETVPQYTNRTVEDVLAQDFDTTPLEFVIERLLHKWDMTLEQLAFELYGMSEVSCKQWVVSSCLEELQETYGYYWGDE